MNEYFGDYIRRDIQRLFPRLNTHNFRFFYPEPFIPFEIKLGSTVKQRMLGTLKFFMQDTGAQLGILVNNSEKIERVADKIVQIPATYL